jgi:hypothetical protein
VAVCTIAITFPYLSTTSVSLLMGITFGVVLFTRDVSVLLENRLRTSINAFVSSIVLDDVWRAIFDPQVGWIATSLGTYLGNMAMYTLPLDTEQRTRLVQAALWTGEQQDIGNHDSTTRSLNDAARSILHSPGGWKILLPKQVQSWLQPGQGGESRGGLSEVIPQQHQLRQQPAPLEYQQRREKPVVLETSVTDCESSVADESGSNMDYDHDKVGDNMGMRIPHTNAELTSEFHDETEIENDATTEKHTVPIPSISNPPPVLDPVQVMFSILQEIGKEKMQQLAEAIPDASLETVGLAAVVALGLQMALRHRTRRMVAGALEGLLALTLSGISLGALSAAVARHLILERNLPPTIARGHGFPILSLDSSERMAGLIGDLLKRNLTCKGKSILAMMVLMIVGGRRRQPRAGPQA